MKILLLGCGHMGGAMLAGWLTRKDIQTIDVVEPSNPHHPDPHVRIHTRLPAHVDCDITVIAVKPQIIQVVCASLVEAIGPGIPVLSIAAGVTLASLGKYLGPARPVIRAMPNTPGAIGQGITGFTCNMNVNTEQRDMVDLLLSTLGYVVEVPEEEQMDAVTAVSGSGPAYIYAFTEALEKAAIKAGLDEEIAAKLARQTVVGAATLMGTRPTQSPGALRRAVTSPGGTTEAALNALIGNQALDILVEEAVKAAAQRSKDLAQSQ